MMTDPTKKRPTSLQKTIQKAKRRARRARQYRSYEERVAEAIKAVWEIFVACPGSYWVCREGDVHGPDDREIPPWCEGVKGLRSHLGLWHPAGSAGSGRVLWKRLIYPVQKVSELEMLAETGEGEE